MTSPAQLVLTSQAEAIRNTVIISFLLLEKTRRTKENTSEHIPLLSKHLGQSSAITKIPLMIIVRIKLSVNEGTELFHLVEHPAITDIPLIIDVE